MFLQREIEEAGGGTLVRKGSSRGAKQVRVWWPYHEWVRMRLVLHWHYYLYPHIRAGLCKHTEASVLQHLFLRTEAYSPPLREWEMVTWWIGWMGSCGLILWDQPTEVTCLLIQDSQKLLVHALWLYKAQETIPSQGGFLRIALVWLSSLYLLTLCLLDWQI